MGQGRSSQGSRNGPRPLRRRTVRKKYRSERKGRRSRNMALEYNAVRTATAVESLDNADAIIDALACYTRFPFKVPKISIAIPYSAIASLFCL